jgi:vitamin-K-epoxide reductase (warfarin-sensitive)
MILILALIGLLVSLYAYYVEYKIKNVPEYTAACDINDRFSCSKPILSEYGSLFYVSNSIAGIIYYSSILLFTLLNMHILVVVATSGAALVSCYLAYILYTKIKTICLVCTALYIVNFLLLVFALKNA